MFWSLIIAGLAYNVVLSRVVINEIPHCSEFSCPDGACVSVQRACDGVADCADGFDEDICRPGANSSLTLGDVFSRVKRQSQCRKSEWPCRDGSCIAVYAKCDGIVDCPDRSDESHALCRNFECPDNLFRCTYGACVDGTAACNGIQECADNSDELQPECKNVNRVVKGRFMCNNGQEISAVELCDGDLNCEDGSDEKLEACAGKTCPNYLFQCAYGACVDGKSDCNGIQECADGSDESDELCNRTTTAVVTPSPVATTTSLSWSSGSCPLPPYPANGRYEVRGAPSDKPGQPFTNVKHLTVTCDSGYAVNGNATRFIWCDPGVELANDVPKCQRYCELNEHHSVLYECERRSLEGTFRGNCTTMEFVGTTVIPTCRTPNYRGNPGYMHCTEKGWDFVAKCVPGLAKNGTNITILVKDKIEIYIGTFEYSSEVDPSKIQVAKSISPSVSDIDEIDWRFGDVDMKSVGTVTNIFNLGSKYVNDKNETLKITVKFDKAKLKVSVGDTVFNIGN